MWNSISLQESLKNSWRIFFFFFITVSLSCQIFLIWSIENPWRLLKSWRAPTSKASNSDRKELKCWVIEVMFAFSKASILNKGYWLIGFAVVCFICVLKFPLYILVLVILGNDNQEKKSKCQKLKENMMQYKGSLNKALSGFQFRTKSSHLLFWIWLVKPSINAVLLFSKRNRSSFCLFYSICSLTSVSPCLPLSPFPPEDGYVRMFLRGRPVTMHIPDEQRESYSIDHKVALPDRKLKLQWVYPSGKRESVETC